MMPRRRFPRTKIGKIRICPRWYKFTAGMNRVSRLSSNPETSIRSSTNSLAGKASFGARYAMAENPRTDAILLEGLAEDSNSCVQNRAKRTQALLKAEETFLSDQGRS